MPNEAIITAFFKYHYPSSNVSFDTIILRENEGSQIKEYQKVLSIG